MEPLKTEGTDRLEPLAVVSVHGRRRTQAEVTFQSLPHDVILCVTHFLGFLDLISLQKVCATPRRRPPSVDVFI